MVKDVDDLATLEVLDEVSNPVELNLNILMLL